jgi:hypothetical protein
MLNLVPVHDEPTAQSERVRHRVRIAPPRHNPRHNREQATRMRPSER